MIGRVFYIILTLNCIIQFTCFSSFAQKLPANSSAFIENKGQILDQNYLQNNDVLFLYSGKGLKIQLRKSGYSYELFSVDGIPKNSNKKFQEPEDLMKTKIIDSRVDIDFIGINPNTEVIAEPQNVSQFNYFISGKKIADVRSYNKVIYKNVFPQTDIEFILNGEQGSPFKYNIILNPGADIEKVKFLVKGASLIKSANGDITFSTPGGNINETIPESFYSASPNKKEQVDFNIKNNIISFSADYNNQQKFVIDPSTNRIWGTYFGGSTLDYCTATDIDQQNNVYVTGYTLSTTNIATSGVYQSTLNGSFDVYLAKFNSNGIRLWATYFGGSSVDAAYGMCIAKNGDIYLCGDTFSTNNIGTVGAHQTVYGGGVDDAILVKFDTAGQLLWSTYFGGLLHDIAIGVVEDSDGNVMMSGHSESSNAIATPGAYNTAYSGGGFDVYIAKFDSAGVLQWGTYYGELGVEETFAIDCDSANNIYITGFTTSSNNIATTSGYQTVYGGQQDAFIAKFDPTGTTLLYGSYYGGTGNDQGTSIKLDSAGTIFIVGNTTSLTDISSPGSYQPAIGSADDGFVARFNTAFVRQWATYFGGNDVDYIADLTFDSNENLLFCGSTMSTNCIGTTNAYQPNLATIYSYDSYFEKFDKMGIREQGSYFGGSSNDHGRGITIDNSGKIYIAGETSSTDSIASPGAFNTIWAGGDDAFLAKFCIAKKPWIFPSETSTICFGDTLWLSTQPGFASYQWSNGSSANPLITTDTASPGTYYYTVTADEGNGCSGITDSSIVIVDICTSLIENEPDPSIKIFPVPSSDLLFIDVKGVANCKNVETEIYSSTGMLISKNTNAGNPINLDIKKLSPGIYFLRVKVNEEIFQKKFIRQ